MEEITCSRCGGYLTETGPELTSSGFFESATRFSSRSGSGTACNCPICPMETKQKATSASVSTLINGCGNCKEDTPAVSWCMQCGNLLCENCNTTRHWKVQSHYVIRIEEFLEMLASDLASNSCQIHGKQLMMHCSTCSSQVCQDCIIKDHSKHKLTVQKTRTLEQMKHKQSQQIMSVLKPNHVAGLVN